MIERGRGFIAGIRRAVFERGNKVKEPFRRDQVYQVIVVRPFSYDVPDHTLIGETKHPHISRAAAEASKNVRIKFPDGYQRTPTEERLEALSASTAAAMATFIVAVVSTAANMGIPTEEVDIALNVGLDAGREMRGSPSSYVRIVPIAPPPPRSR